jgi:hypothetical protein
MAILHTAAAQPPASLVAQLEGNPDGGECSGGKRIINAYVGTLFPLRSNNTKVFISLETPGACIKKPPNKSYFAEGLNP